MTLHYKCIMDRETAIVRLREHQTELREFGVVSLALFGSVARDEGGPQSDVDVAVTLAPGPERGLAYLARLDALKQRLTEMLGVPVDIVAEPTSRRRIQDEIDRDRQLAF